MTGSIVSFEEQVSRLQSPRIASTTVSLYLYLVSLSGISADWSYFPGVPRPEVPLPTGGVLRSLCVDPRLQIINSLLGHLQITLLHHITMIIHQSFVIMYNVILMLSTAQPHSTTYSNSTTIVNYCTTVRLVAFFTANCCS